VVVAEGERLAQREFEHLLRARRERDLSGRDLVALADHARDLRADLLDGDVERLQDAGCEPLLLTQEAEKDVLGADVVVLESACLVLGQDDDLPSPFCKAFEQPLDPPFRLMWSGDMPTPSKVKPMVAERSGPTRPRSRSLYVLGTNRPSL